MYWLAVYCIVFITLSLFLFLQVQVGDRLLSLNGEELMELTSKDCEYTLEYIYVHNYYLPLLSAYNMHMHVVTCNMTQ